MVASSQQAAVEGSTPACHEFKRKVVGNIEVEQSCKFKVDLVIKKQLWRFRL